jgi:hypothetical protein
MSLAQASWVAAHHNLLITGPSDIASHYLSLLMCIGK